MGDIIYKELSYQVVGGCFDVYNELGYGHREKYYHRALAKSFEKLTLSFQREKKVNLQFKGEKVGKQFVDFLIEGKLILEVKTYPYFKVKNSHYKQTLGYLKALECKLAILVYFTKEGVKFKRIVN